MYLKIRIIIYFLHYVLNQKPLSVNTCPVSPEEFLYVHNVTMDNMFTFNSKNIRLKLSVIIDSSCTVRKRAFS